MSTNLVIEASKCTLDVPSADREKCERLTDLRASMLPAEATARAELDARIADLERRQRAEERGQLLDLSILSPEVFTWRKNGLPAFAVFDIAGDGECVISTNPAKEKLPLSCKEFYRNALEEPLTNRMQKFFTEHFKSIWCGAALLVEVGYFYTAQAAASATWGRFLLGLGLGVLASFCASLMLLIAIIAGWILLVREKERTASARLMGAIPFSVKQKIKQYEPQFKEIIVVSEAIWDLTEHKKAAAIPACLDPLVVGWDGDYHWIIDRFNTSTLEQLASDEFAVKADGLDLDRA